MPGEPNNYRNKENCVTFFEVRVYIKRVIVHADECNIRV